MSVSSAEQVRIGFFFPVNWKARVRFYLFCMLLSLLLHWLLVATTPDDWWHVEPKVAKSRDLMVEVIAEEDIPDQWRYFESNPNVPSHVPTDTPLISDKDQQAAQPEPAPEIDELLPALEGDMEEANKVVSGERPMTPEEIAELLEPVTPAELATMGGGGAPQPSTTTEETAQTEGEPGGIHNE